MSSPLVWILLPGICALALYLLRRRERLTQITGIVLCTLLAWLGWLLPIGERTTLGPLSFELADTLAVLGRRFTLGDADRPVLILIYLTAAFWFMGSAVARTNRLFIPSGLGITILLIAALAVDPFLYAALLIEMAVLISIPLLVSPGKSPGRGVLRFLVFQTLGMPFLLFSGWVMAGLENGTGDPNLVFRAGTLVTLGFVFFLGVFPFNSWIPMLGEESQPYSAAFILFLLPLAVSLFGLEFIQRYEWLRASAGLYELLRLGGVVMVFLGGLWAAFQRHLGRMMGYAVIVEIGLMLLALGSGTGVAGETQSLEVFFALMLPRGLALGLWALALVSIQAHTEDLRFRSIAGIAHTLPVASTVLILAHFSMAGFPLLAGFPAHYAIWENLAARFPALAMISLLGNAGLMVGGLRTLAVLVMRPIRQERPLKESWGQTLLLAAGGIALVVMGLLPQWTLPATTRLANLFLQTGLR